MQKLRIYRVKSALQRGTKHIDALGSALGELFFIEHPRLYKSDPRAKALLAAYRKKSRIKSVWAYYPWRRTAVRIPEERAYFRLRTARNRDLITTQEQSAYRRAVVGVAGLSVGSAAVASIVATGGPRRLKIADPDIIEITNLNRIHATLLDIESNKALVSAQAVWEVDPFAEIDIWPQGIHQTDVETFISGAPKLTVFVDEMDDIGMKFACRAACRAARVPVLMATDNGDSIIIDVERFDLEPKRAIFHGRVPLPQGDMGQLSRSQFVALANQIIDPAYFTKRQQQSILGIGKHLAGIAQIATAAAIAGAAIAFAVRRI